MPLPVDSSAPAYNAIAVTPSDSVNFAAGPCRALYVGGAGNVVGVTAAGETATFTGLLAGVVYPFALRRVNNTSTTATNMVALY